MSPHRSFICLAAVLLSGASLSADRVRLRSGQSVEGTLVGADATVVTLVLTNGRRAQFPVADVAALEFAPRREAAPPPQPTRRAAPITVPAQTILNVRLTQGIDVDAAGVGTTFRALLDDPVMLNGRVVIPRGAGVTLQAVNVQQSGKMKGSDKITLKANSLSYGGVSYEIVTSYVESKGQGEGKKTGRKVGGGIGLGAIVGGIAGGGEGAAIGAAVGGITGAVVASQGEEHLKLPAETRLQFQLASAVTVRP
jgi:outer membrane lipoprotein SlyB